MQETYLIKLRDNFGEEDFMRVVSFLKKDKSQIVTASFQGGWIIAALAQGLAETIKRFPAVKMVAGVTFIKREVRVIRIQK